MGTPTYINFSRSKGLIIDTIQLIEKYVCDPWRCRLDRFTYLRISDDPWDGGYEMDGDKTPPCRDMDDVTAILETGRPFGLVYLCRETRANFYVYFTEIETDTFTVTVDVETSFVYYRNDDHPEPGRWFEGWLISLAIAIHSKICEYGIRKIHNRSLVNMSLEEILAIPTEEFIEGPLYEALDPATILERLRTGDLLALPDPGFHAISIDLIESSEIQSLVKKGPCAPRLVYRAAPGYHILANISFGR